MEALILFVFFGIYIAFRVIFGAKDSAWEKQKKTFRKGLYLLKEGYREEARTYFTQCSQRRPYESLPWVMLGEICLMEDENEKAVFYAQKALRLDNTIAEAHMLMSKGLKAMGEYKAAFQMAKKAAWFGRKNADANLLAGHFYLETGDVEKGIRHLETAYALSEEIESSLLRDNVTKRKNWK